MFDIEKMKIKPLCMQAMDAAREHLDDLVKPIGALGGMEELAVRLAGITGVVKGDYSQRAVLVFAADNGIWDEGISPVPQEVTAAQTLNILNGLGQCGAARGGCGHQSAHCAPVFDCAQSLQGHRQYCTRPGNDPSAGTRSDADRV